MFFTGLIVIWCAAALLSAAGVVLWCLTELRSRVRQWRKQRRRRIKMPIAWVVPPRDHSQYSSASQDSIDNRSDVM